MTDVVVVGEGPTERSFTVTVLAHSLAERRVFVQPRLIPTSRSAKGGALKSARVLRFLRNTLRERQDTFVTTLFDLYGLPSDFPGRAGTTDISDPLKRASAIEQTLHATVIAEAECRPDRFLPHIQPYEFEALLFSDVQRLAEAERDWTPQLKALRDARQSASSPEHINDGPTTHPSARLTDLLPRYSKTRHGVAIADRIGLSRMRAECRHFGKWLDRLEALARGTVME